jgi:hypothetical protein
MKEASGASKSAREQEDDEDDDEDAEEDEEVDDVVDRLKNEEDLDPHEQRLLACIVNPGELSINRSFRWRLIKCDSQYADLIQPSSSTTPHDRRYTHDCIASLITSTGLSTGHFKGTRHDWLSSFRSSWHR